MNITVIEFETSLSAFDLYTRFQAKDIFFLDSAKVSDKLGQYSFIGLNPFKKITYSDGAVYEDGQAVTGDLFELLNRVLAAYRVENRTDLPFIGGCMGMLSYDLARGLEKLPEQTWKGMDVPDLYMVFYDNVIIADHLRNRFWLTSLNRQANWVEQTQKLLDEIGRYEPKSYVSEYTEKDPELNSDFTEEGYKEAVEGMRQYIRSGDVYIANMTQTFEGTTKEDSFRLYRHLREKNPAPFGACLPLEDLDILCSSPERFLQIHNGKVVTRPIKGTRPRGEDPEADEMEKRRLEASEKDRAELLMVVDLERNDLSKVCRPHTVKVTELFKIESYATVHHLVAEVEGQLKHQKTAVDCMKACFPGGSITGTPKIRAMEVIESLEKRRRGIYTGCIGYFGFDGGADFNIAIRTICKQADRVTVGVGGGITWESDPEAEYLEMLDKGRALFEVLKMKEQTDEDDHQ